MSNYCVIAKYDLEAGEHTWEKSEKYTVSAQRDHIHLATDTGRVTYKSKHLPLSVMKLFEIDVINAVAFESKDRPGMFVSDGIELADENGETNLLEEALLVIRDDFKEPDDKDLDGFYGMMSSLHFFNYEEFRKMSKPKFVQITTEQLLEIRERNEW